MYEMNFLFEHGGTCFWSKNDNAIEKFGYAVNNDELPICKQLKENLNLLESEYATILDWDTPQNPLLWTRTKKQDFVNRATEIFNEVQKELGEKFYLTNDVASSVYFGSDQEKP